MEVQKIERGMYLTHALVEIDHLDHQRIIGIEDGFVNFGEKSESRYYWSEVIHEGNATMVWKKGILLVNATPEELSALQKQSLINLSSGCMLSMNEVEDAIVKKYSHE